MYDKEYYDKRNFQDKLRLKQFLFDKCFINKFVNDIQTVLDVGCSTGEFLITTDIGNQKYGMEISDYAIKIAKENNINFDKSLFTEKNFFDVIIFRGSIQHIKDPIMYLERAYTALKPGGMLFLLATPNTDSIIYKCFNSLHMLTNETTYLWPSKSMLKNILINLNYKKIVIEEPYLESAYANPIVDFTKFIFQIITRKKYKYAFKGNIINIVARK